MIVSGPPGARSAISPEPVVVGRVTGIVDRQDGPGPRSDRRGDGVRVDQERRRVDVGEARLGARVEDRIGRGHEGQRRSDRLVARPQTGGGRRAVEGRGPR